MRGQREEPGGLRLVLGGLQPLADQVRQAPRRAARVRRCAPAGAPEPAALVRRTPAPREHPDGDGDGRRETPRCGRGDRAWSSPSCDRAVTDPGPTRPPRTRARRPPHPIRGPAPTAAERTRSMTCRYHRWPSEQRASGGRRGRSATVHYWPGARAPPPLPDPLPGSPARLPERGGPGGDTQGRRARHADRALALPGAAHRGVRGAGPARVALRAVRGRRGRPAGFVAGWAPSGSGCR